jgi:uncharacterized protein YdeI (YjbR/CyaY-like superfamily)
MIQAKSVEEYISKSSQKELLTALRELCLKTELLETVKWGMPVYTINNKNIIGIGAFKSYAGLWFYQGVFLEDRFGVQINAQEGKTKAMRQWRFSSIKELDKNMILSYLEEAIQNQKEGKEIKVERKSGVNIPNELKREFDRNSELVYAFKKLSPGKQREYAEYIAEAKRDATKLSRLEKIKPMIQEGIGLNDKYK